MRGLCADSKSRAMGQAALLCDPNRVCRILSWLACGDYLGVKGGVFRSRPDRVRIEGLASRESGFNAAEGKVCAPGSCAKVLFGK